MDRWYECPQCNENILYGTNPCPFCKYSLAWSQQGPIEYIEPSDVTQQRKANTPESIAHELKKNAPMGDQDNTKLLKALEKSKDTRISRLVEAYRELHEWLSGKTPLGFLAWLRWITLIFPFRAAYDGVPWWQCILLWIALFAIVSAISPLWKRHKVSELISEIQKLESQVEADGSLAAEIERFKSTKVE